MVLAWHGVDQNNSTECAPPSEQYPGPEKGRRKRVKWELSGSLMIATEIWVTSHPKNVAM